MHRCCRCIVLLALLLPALSVCAQRDTCRLRVMSYNVENLFDTRHDTLRDDTEFLPDGVRHWTRTKYVRKLNDVARVIISVGGDDGVPELVGLCEVENDSVLVDLTQHSLLRRAGYRYVMTDSPDRRGIDVALLYQRGSFRLLGVECLRVPTPAGGHNATRDILHAVGQLPDDSTLDVFVCHFPSRSGGQRETEPRRLLAARTLKHAVDSIISLREKPQVVIMGDFNDYPHDRSLTEVLHAQLSEPDSPEPDALYSLLGIKAQRMKSGFGSYCYRGTWGLLDHLIVNGSLLRDDATCHVVSGSADVFRHGSLLEDDTRYGGKKPRRTFNGMEYNGGTSDHLPVCFDLTVTYF